jgi:integrase
MLPAAVTTRAAHYSGRSAKAHRTVRSGSDTGRRLRAGAHLAAALGLDIGAHTLRATAATNALDHQTDIAKVQERLGHANIAPPASTIIALRGAR